MNTLHIVAPVAQELIFPDREVLLIHRTINYLLSVGVHKENILVIGPNLPCIAWADNQGFGTKLCKLIIDGIEEVQQQYPDRDLLIYAVNTPIREKNLVALMESQTKTQKDVLFVSSAIIPCLTDYKTWSVFGIKHGSKPLSRLITENSYYEVYHSPEAAHIVIEYPYQYDEKVLDAWTERVFKMDAWTAPCDPKYPRRAIINVDGASPKA